MPIFLPRSRRSRSYGKPLICSPSSRISPFEIRPGGSSNPITFTTLDAETPVYWRGIFLGQGSDGSVLDAVTVSFGGRNDNTGNVNLLAGSLVTIGAVSFTDSDNYAGVIFDGGSATFAGSPASRVYVGNGFDCILDVRAGTCEPL